MWGLWLAGPEEKARKKIDRLLEAAGWKLQGYKDLNLGAGLGVAVREFPLGIESADYLLLVDRKAVGAVEEARRHHAERCGGAVGEVCEDFASEGSACG